MTKKEASSGKRGRGSQNSRADVRKQLEDLLDYKRRELHMLEHGDDNDEGEQALDILKSQLQEVKEMVDDVDRHYHNRLDVLGQRKEALARLRYEGHPNRYEDDEQKRS